MTRPPADYGQRDQGAAGINGNVAQAAGAGSDIALMKFVEGRDREAAGKCALRPEYLPAGARSAPGPEKKKGENAVLAQMGQFTNHEVQQAEGFGLHPSKKYFEHFAGMFGRKWVRGCAKHERHPQQCRQPVEKEFSRARVHAVLSSQHSVQNSGFSIQSTPPTVEPKRSWSRVLGCDGAGIGLLTPACN